MPTAAYTERYIPTTSEYGYPFDFFENNRVDLPPDTAILITIQLDTHPAQYYFDRGVTAVHVNTGTSPDTLTALGIPPERRFSLMGKFYIRVQGKQFSQFGPADVEQAVATWFAQRNSKYMTTDSEEDAEGTVRQIFDQNPAMWTLLERRMGEEAKARGCLYFGGYGGSFTPILRGNDLAKQNAAMVSGEALLAHLKDGTPGGGRSGQFPYWAENLHLSEGTHITVNGYYRGFVNPHDRLHDLETQLSGIQMVRDYACPDKKIMFYTEGVDNEFTGYTAVYRRNLPLGGYQLFYTFPGIDFGYMLTQYFRAFQCCNAVNGWKPDRVFGTNPNVVSLAEPGQSVYFADGSNNNPQFANTAILSNMGQVVAAYTDHPIGFENAIGVAAKWVKLAYDAVGSKAWKRPTIIMDGTTYTPGVGQTFVKTVFDNNLPYAWGYYNATTGRGWMMAHYNAGKMPVTVKLMLDGFELTVTLLPGVPRFFTFRLADG